MVMVQASQQQTCDDHALLDAVQQSVSTVIRGKESSVKVCLAALLARGHILIEDIPGVGKTTLARSLAKVVGGSFNRIQFTSDLLPSDVLGVSVFKKETESFEFLPGPLFANIVLADEINRTTPRSQSALLEAMSENTINVDDKKIALPDPFMVIATQNPTENIGTYPLPESQMDRFIARIHLGYPDRDNEIQVLKNRRKRDPIQRLDPLLTPDAIMRLQERTENIAVNDALVDYAMTIIDKTRNHKLIDVGVSTRGSLAWYRLAQAMALLGHRDFCIPDDFKASAVMALGHRIKLAQSSSHGVSIKTETENTIGQILNEVDVPL